MNKERLLKLAAHLRTVPEERFDYSQWAGDDWKGAPDLSCGTTACALGWATTEPTLAALGLCLMRFRWDSFLGREPEYGRPRVVLVGERGEVVEQDPIHAAMHVFDLTEAEAEYLFIYRMRPPDGLWELGESPAKAAGALEVAVHIEKFVEAAGEVRGI